MNTERRLGWWFPLALSALMWCVVLLVGHAAFAQQSVLPGYQVCVNTSGTTQCSFQPVDATHGLPIAGTITASLAPFGPSVLGSRMTSLTVTVADSSGTLPTGTAVVVSNVGANPMYCNTANVAATVSDQLISANGGWFVFAPGAVTTLHCIATGGSTTANGVGGTGLPAGTGAGGSGGAITAASGAFASGSIASGAIAAGSHAVGAGVDGWDLTQGAIADAAVAAGASGSVNAHLRAISRDTGTTATNSGLPQPAQTTNGVNIGAVMNAGSKFIAVAASSTATVLQTSTGAIGDYLSHCVIYPTSTSPGVVTVFDNTNTAATSAILFAGGASSTSNLTPISVPVGALSAAGAWKVTTGSAVSVVCFGKFS